MAKNSTPDVATALQEYAAKYAELAPLKAERDAAEASFNEVDERYTREIEGFGTLVEIIGHDPMNVLPRRRATGKRDPNRRRNVLIALSQGGTMAELREATGEDHGYINSVMSADAVKGSIVKTGDAGSYHYQFTGVVPDEVTETEEA